MKYFLYLAKTNLKRKGTQDWCLWNHMNHKNVTVSTWTHLKGMMKP